MKTRFDPQRHHRCSIRFRGYDYTSEGAYFVTIVTQARDCLFGEIIDGEMYLSNYGLIVKNWWSDVPSHFLNVETGAFIIMPNHIHGIIFIADEHRAETISPHSQDGKTSHTDKPTLGQIVAYFKYQSTKEINAIDNTGVITKIWQRNYHEHIIRNEKELKQKSDYILDNPCRWDDDQENPKNKKSLRSQ